MERKHNQAKQTKQNKTVLRNQCIDDDVDIFQYMLKVNELIENFFFFLSLVCFIIHLFKNIVYIDG